jgi:hypothetical protein
MLRQQLVVLHLAAVVSPLTLDASEAPWNDWFSLWSFRISL